MAIWMQSYIDVKVRNYSISSYTKLKEQELQDTHSYHHQKQKKKNHYWNSQVTSHFYMMLGRMKKKEKKRWWVGRRRASASVGSISVGRS